MPTTIGIDQEHPEYRAKQAMWRRYHDLYVGGELLKQHAAEYLERRQKEPPDVYSERLSKVFYENYVGSIIDWYAATLFRREPNLSLEGQDDPARRFFARFTEDCDRQGTSLSDFFRQQLIEALVKGTSYILVDFPRPRTQPLNRAEEEALGVDQAYVVGYSPEHLINWSADEFGEFEWVVLRDTFVRKASLEADGWTTETRWLYFDRSEFRVYRRVEQEGGAPIELVDQGPHAFAAQGRVPLFDLTVSQGLWLMNKAGLLQLEHFNKSNALSWALTMGLYAMPVVYSERAWDQIVGESYYIQLGPGDRFGWTEPEGRVYQIAAENLSRLQEEIYRVCYLLQQGGAAPGGVVQSGLSKQRDFAITQEVLRAYGDVVKDGMKRVLRAIAAARGDSVQIELSGLDEFDIGDFHSQVADAERILALGVPSPTLRKQIFKKIAHQYLCDLSQDVKDQIAQEIENGLIG